MKHMKKAISVMMALTLLAAGGCGSSGGTSTSTATAATGSAPASTAATAPATTGKTIVIKYGLISPDSHSSTQAARKFAEYVEKESNGEMKVEVYPNALLGGDVQMTESVALGTLQMALPSTSTLVMYSPKFGALDMPFMFTSTEKAFEGLNSDVGALLNAELEKVGIKNLAYNFNGKRCITNNIRPINEPADLKGVKMRVMESPIFIDMFTLLGTNPTPISFGELFTALQQKTVDGEENAASLVYDSKFYEVQKYFSKTNHVYGFCANIINLDFYNGLSDKNKAILDAGAKQWLGEWQIAQEDGSNDEYIKKLEEAGMSINDVSPENLKKFADAVAPMYEKYKKDMGSEIFDLIAKYK